MRKVTNHSLEMYYHYMTKAATLTIMAYNEIESVDQFDEWCERAAQFYNEAQLYI